jgi:hypothetical protein
MIKKITLIVLFLSLTSCGYQSIYSSNKQSDYKNFNQIEMEGNKSLNRKIFSLLNLNETTDSIYDLKIKSEKTNFVEAKDKAGNPSVYNFQIKTEIYILKNKIIFKKKKFEENFNYSKTGNNFDLLQYQNNIEKNLIDKITDKIIIFLNS